MCVVSFDVYRSLLQVSFEICMSVLDMFGLQTSLPSVSLDVYRSLLVFIGLFRICRSLLQVSFDVYMSFLDMFGLQRSLL